ncbi:MAG: DUF922 domain-containing protein [Gammaproteobacteria bacterium]|nr:DUF922 domain-containing protein [Gammaproteobacteria bacterium]
MLVLLLMAAQIVDRQIAVAEELADTQYYLIFGSNPDELAAEISRKGPDGFTAHTKWNIRTRYHYVKLDSGCLLDFSSVDLDIKYIMPKWANKEDAPLKLQRSWENWYAKLVAHENRHASNGEAAQRAIQHVFLLRSHSQTCAQLKRDIDSMTRDILARYAMKDERYDQLTNHGETEGINRIFTEGAN